MTPACATYNGCCCGTAVYAFANISGGHLNPAVSFALMCTGHMKWWKGLLYMICQVRIQLPEANLAQPGQHLMPVPRYTAIVCSLCMDPAVS